MGGDPVNRMFKLEAKDCFRFFFYYLMVSDGNKNKMMEFVLKNACLRNIILLKWWITMVKKAKTSPFKQKHIIHSTLSEYENRNHSTKHLSRLSFSTIWGPPSWVKYCNTLYGAVHRRASLFQFLDLFCSPAWQTWQFANLLRRTGLCC